MYQSINVIMKILFVASKYDYGIPQRGFSYEYFNFYYTLMHMGHECIFFDFVTLLREHGKEEMNRLLIDTVDLHQPDLMFTVLFQDQIKIDTIKKITDSNPKKIIAFNWFCDDHWRFENFSRYYAPCFSWVSTTAQSALLKYQYIGYKNVIKTQWAANHFLYKKSELPIIHDVSFVGAPHGNRRKIISEVMKSGVDCKVWGTGWNSNIFYRIMKKLHFVNIKAAEDALNKSRISQEDMIKVFSQSKINLNLTASSKTRYEEQIKGRTFEVPACGGFLLTGYADNLEEYFDIGKEIVCFKDCNKMIELISYYLKHEKEREEIAEAGYQKTIKEHTYEKRFNDIFKIMGLI